MNQSFIEDIIIRALGPKLPKDWTVHGATTRHNEDYIAVMDQNGDAAFTIVVTEEK